MSDDKPKALTSEEFDRLKPRSQGYVSYMQAAWNKAIPNKPIYEKGTPAFKEWVRGTQIAILEVQDYDD